MQELVLLHTGAMRMVELSRIRNDAHTHMHVANAYAHTHTHTHTLTCPLGQHLQSACYKLSHPWTFHGHETWPSPTPRCADGKVGMICGPGY